MIKHELHVKQAKKAELEAGSSIAREDTIHTCALSRRFSAKALGLGTTTTLEMT